MESEAFHWRITVPPNATATVHVSGDAAKITEGGTPVARSRGVRFVRSETGETVYEVGSGSYSFASPLAKQGSSAD